jgi:DNA-directed RNA polymerase subunit K/omega
MKSFKEYDFNYCTRRVLMLMTNKEALELSKQAMQVVKSRYLLCILLSQRIHQLEKGAPPAIDVDPDEYSNPKMFLKLSLKEIIEGNMEEPAKIESA